MPPCYRGPPGSPGLVPVWFTARLRLPECCPDPATVDPRLSTRARPDHEARSLCRPDSPTGSVPDQSKRRAIRPWTRRSARGRAASVVLPGVCRARSASSPPDRIGPAHRAPLASALRQPARASLVRSGPGRLRHTEAALPQRRLPVGPASPIRPVWEEDFRRPPGSAIARIGRGQGHGGGTNDGFPIGGTLGDRRDGRGSRRSEPEGGGLRRDGGPTKTGLDETLRVLL